MAIEGLKVLVSLFEIRFVGKMRSKLAGIHSTGTKAVESTMAEGVDVSFTRSDLDSMTMTTELLGLFMNEMRSMSGALPNRPPEHRGSIVVSSFCASVLKGKAKRDPQLRLMISFGFD